MSHEYSNRPVCHLFLSILRAKARCGEVALNLFTGSVSAGLKTRSPGLKSGASTKGRG
jgi:hypothetical protein